VSSAAAHVLALRFISHVEDEQVFRHLLQQRGALPKR
jgi:hypothetical protein